VVRAWHFVRSLPWTRPRLLPHAINDWIAGLAMRDYVDRHFAVATTHTTVAGGVARLRLAVQRARADARVRLAFERAASDEDRVSVQIIGTLDRALARRLAHQLRQLLERTQAHVVVAIEAWGEIEGRGVKQLLRSLERHGDRVAVVVGEGLRELLRVETVGSDAVA
jgi:hypothetical protein